VQQVATEIVQWKTRVIDLDLRAYIDTVRHHLLLEKVACRVADDEVMGLLNLILKASSKRRGINWERWSRRCLYEELKLFNGYRVRRPPPKVAPA